MKVSWSKVKRRTRVLLLNIFKLRDLWGRCHPGKAMRFVSFDEKPSWMNNAGLTDTFFQKGSHPNVREGFAQTRERYTIMTGVQSWPGKPKWGMSFKGAPKGQIYKDLQKFHSPDWLRLCTQECGSYRDSDILDFLEWALPDARTSDESIVLMLDWDSSHRTDDVMELVRLKGHVLIFH